MAEQHQSPEENEEEEETLDQTSDENDDLEQLEEDVKLMVQKIAEFRDILPHQRHSTLASILSARRPTVHFNTDPPPSGTHNSESLALVEDDPAQAEKLETIKQKFSSNTSAMSIVSKRMKDCMSRINKLDSVNKEIHPAFKRRKITSENRLL